MTKLYQQKEGENDHKKDGKVKDEDREGTEGVLQRLQDSIANRVTD